MIYVCPIIIRKYHNCSQIGDTRPQYAYHNGHQQQHYTERSGTGNNQCRAQISNSGTIKANQVQNSNVFQVSFETKLYSNAEKGCNSLVDKLLTKSNIDYCISNLGDNVCSVLY